MSKSPTPPGSVEVNLDSAADTEPDAGPPSSSSGSAASGVATERTEPLFEKEPPSAPRSQEVLFSTDPPARTSFSEVKGRSSTLVSGGDQKKPARPAHWLSSPRRANLVFGAGIYLLCTALFLAFASRDLLTEHTPFNHFALLAETWLDGNLHLPGKPPAYAQNNDFARFEGKWFVTFPPFPAMLLVPFVALSGDAESVRDGQIFLWLAGLGPVFLFLALQKLSVSALCSRSRWQNAVLALCFGLGTVYFFSVEQGTVWYAAHVVSVLLAALYLLFSIGASAPLLAGLMIGLGLMTRAPLAFAVPFFALEALRVCAPVFDPSVETSDTEKSLWTRLGAYWNRLDKARLFKLYALFSVPIVCALLFTFWHNAARFGDPFDTGYRHLTVAWQARMNKWGLFHYHYLAKNLGVMLSSLPWYEPARDVPFRINVHGLALWFTTPLYFWLLWPKHRPAVHWSLWLTVLCVALPTLFYQNPGWAQFGYRFSNDYAVFLFALLATGMRPMRALFGAAAIWGLVINAFGALTFNRGDYRDFYFWQGSQERLYQKD